MGERASSAVILALLMLGCVPPANSLEFAPRTYNKSALNPNPAPISTQIAAVPGFNTILATRIPSTRTPMPKPTEESGNRRFDTSLIADYIFVVTNEYRVKHGLPKLTRDPRIDSIALSHAEWMSSSNVLSHDDGLGRGPTDRAIEAGYECRVNYGSHYSYGLSENIIQGNTHSGSILLNGIIVSYNYYTNESLARGLVDNWIESPGHRANILDKDAKRIGIGVAIPKVPGAVWATQNFCAKP